MSETGATNSPQRERLRLCAERIVEFYARLAHEMIDQFVDFSFSRSGHKRALTDYVMAFWFAELAIRKTKESTKAYRDERTTPNWTVKNPYYVRTKSANTARLVRR